MPAERFFSNQDYVIAQPVVLLDQEYHHLVHVMRIKEGETVEIVNGRGALATAEVIHLDKKRATLVVKSLYIAKPSTREIILAQANPRSSNLEFILEKGTELGMTQLWLFPTALGGRKGYTEQQMERMKSVTVAAMKQCGRLYLPVIAEKPLLDKWKGPLPFPAFFGDVDSAAPDFVNVSSGIIFFIGPESGFTKEEEAILRGLHVKGVKLHDNILRAETAAIVALAFASK